MKYGSLFFPHLVLHFFKASHVYHVSGGSHVTNSEARDKTGVWVTVRAAAQSHSRGRVSTVKDANKQGSRNRYGVTMTTSRKLSGKKKKRKEKKTPLTLGWSVL